MTEDPKNPLDEGATVVAGPRRTDGSDLRRLRIARDPHPHFTAMVTAITYDGAPVREWYTEGTHDREAARRTNLDLHAADSGTTRLRVFLAAAMQAMVDERDARRPTPPRDHSDALRCYATAMTHLEAAQMFAARGATLMGDMPSEWPAGCSTIPSSPETAE